MESSPDSSLDRLALTGCHGVGKNTVADYLVERYGYQKYNLASPIARFVEDLLGVKVDSSTKDIPFDGENTPQSVIIRMKSIINREFYCGKTHTLFSYKVLSDIKRDRPKKFVISDYQSWAESGLIEELGCKVIQVGSSMKMPPDLILKNSGSKEELYTEIDGLLRV